LIERLVRQGLVSREPFADDGRGCQGLRPEDQVGDNWAAQRWTTTFRLCLIRTARALPVALVLILEHIHF
jgi:hypothetical protein